MLTIDMNEIQFSRMGVGFTFWDISQQAYSKYIELKYEFESKCAPECEESMLKYDELEDEIDHNGYIAIIFSSIYLESEIYTYLATHLSDAYVKKYLDKLDLLSKLVVGIKLVTGTNFPTNGQAFECCKKLISYRNKIVHHKSKPFEFDSKKMSANIRDGEKEFNEMVNISQRTIILLEKEISNIHKGDVKPFMAVRNTTHNQTFKLTP